MIVVVRTKDGNGDVAGLHDPNHFLNALTYDVEFLMAKLKSIRLMQ